MPYKVRYSSSDSDIMGYYKTKANTSSSIKSSLFFKLSDYQYFGSDYNSVEFIDRNKAKLLLGGLWGQEDHTSYYNERISSQNFSGVPFVWGYTPIPYRPNDPTQWGDILIHGNDKIYLRWYYMGFLQQSRDGNNWTNISGGSPIIIVDLQGPGGNGGLGYRTAYNFHPGGQAGGFCSVVIDLRKSDQIEINTSISAYYLRVNGNPEDERYGNVLGYPDGGGWIQARSRGSSTTISFTNGGKIQAQSGENGSGWKSGGGYSSYPPGDKYGKVGSEYGKIIKDNLPNGVFVYFEKVGEPGNDASIALKENDSKIEGTCRGIGVSGNLTGDVIDDMSLFSSFYRGGGGVAQWGERNAEYIPGCGGGGAVMGTTFYAHRSSKHDSTVSDYDRNISYSVDKGFTWDVIRGSGYGYGGTGSITHSSIFHSCESRPFHSDASRRCPEILGGDGAAAIHYRQYR